MTALALAFALSIPSVTLKAQSGRYDQGKQIYSNNCVQCHGDPKVGAFGPPNYGSSLELIRSKVLKGEYPPGYKPKRPTSMMPRFNLPDDNLEALYCFLNDKCKSCSLKGGECSDGKTDKQESP